MSMAENESLLGFKVIDSLKQYIEEGSRAQLSAVLNYFPNPKWDDRSKENNVADNLFSISSETVVMKQIKRCIMLKTKVLKRVRK